MGLNGLNKIFEHEPKFKTVPKKERSIILPVPKKERRIIVLYLGNMLNIIKIKQTKTVNKKLKLCKLKLLFKTIDKLKNYSRCKDPVPEYYVLSKYRLCKYICLYTYIGDAYQHIKWRASKYQKVSPRTKKSVRRNLSISGTDHILTCNHREGFKILGTESLFIKRDKPILNRNQFSHELLLF